MEKLVAELKKLVSFKDRTVEGDLVLVAAKEPQMLVYALITGIERDRTRRDEWWHVQMQFLTVPPQPMTWTLREEQFTGREIFTMGGEQRFIRAVHFEVLPEQPDTTVSREKKSGLRVVK